VTICFVYWIKTRWNSWFLWVQCKSYPTLLRRLVPVVIGRNLQYIELIPMSNEELEIMDLKTTCTQNWSACFRFCLNKLNHSFSSSLTILINLYLKCLVPVSQELGLIWNFLSTIQMTHTDHPMKCVSVFRWFNIPHFCYILVTWVRYWLKNQAPQESINLCPLWEFILISLDKLLSRLCVWI
jgi:hypothetical protein